MKKFLFIMCVVSVFVATACSYHGKQPVDDTYYKRTQSVGWPQEAK